MFLNRRSRYFFFAFSSRNLIVPWESHDNASRCGLCDKKRTFLRNEVQFFLLIINLPTFHALVVAQRRDILEQSKTGQGMNSREWRNMSVFTRSSPLVKRLILHDICNSDILSRNRIKILPNLNRPKISLAELSFCRFSNYNWKEMTATTDTLNCFVVSAKSVSKPRFSFVRFG